MKSFFMRTARLIVALTLMFYQAPVLSVVGAPGTLPGAALEVSIDKFAVDTAFNVNYNWTLDKTATPDSFVLATGGTGTTTYTVTVTKTAHSTFSITYTVTIDNKGPGTAEFDLYAIIQNPSGSLTYANEFLERVTLAQGATYVKTHTTDFDIAGVAADIDPLKIGVDIVNFGNTVSSVKHKTSPAVNFAATPTSIYNESLVVTDDWASAGSPWTFTDNGSVSYDRLFSAGAIGTVQYVNTVTAPVTNDGTTFVNLTDSATVTVTTSNTAPTANGQNVTTPEDTALDITLTGTDPDSDPLSFIIVDGPLHGTLVLSSGAIYTYTPDADYVGPDSFTFKANDGSEDSAPATVNIDVTAVNDGPDALDEYITVTEGGNYPVLPTIAQLDATDVDNLLSELTFSLVSGPAHGVAVVNPDGSFTYVHDGSETTDDSFTFRVSDGSLSDVATVYVRVTATNDGPVALDEYITVNEGGNYPILPALSQLDATDVDSPLASLVFTLTSSPLHGVAVVNPDGSFTYVHDGSETTSDSFTFTVTDDGLLTDVGTVYITVLPVNDPVVADDSYITVDEGASYPVFPTIAQLLASDPDTLFANLVFTIDTLPTNGSATVNPDGTFTYTHDGSETTSDYFTFTVTDGEFSDTGAVYVTITAGNDAPVAQDGSFSVLEGGTYPLFPTIAQLMASDADTPFANLTFGLDVQALHGVVTVYPDGTFTYVHDGSENFTDSFEFLVYDEGFLTDYGTVTITIVPVNDPVIADDANITVVEGASYPVLPTIAQLMASDPDTLFANLTFAINTLPVNGTATVNPDGTFTYTHDGSETHSDSFTFSVTDGEFTDYGTVYVTVLPANDAPVADGDSFSVNEGGIHNDYFMFSDPDIFLLPVGFVPSMPVFPFSFEIVRQPEFGTVTITTVFGDYQYEHDGSENFTDYFTFRVYDGIAWSNVARVDITIIPVNDPPVVVDQNLNVDEGGELPGQLEATDPDDTEFTFELVGDPANGSVVVNPDGSFTYVHDGSETLTDSFTYKANDGEADSNIATVTITINPVNDLPEADDDGFTVAEGGVYTGQATGFDPDTPLNEWIFVLDDAPLFGGLTFNSNGSFEYTHNGSETTSDFFTFHIFDGHGNSNIATIEITITPVNDLPVANDFAFTLLQGAIYNNSLYAADNDNAILTFEVVTAPTRGALVLNADGSFSYDHNGVNLLPDYFTFRVFDGQGYSNTATVTIGVNPLPPQNAAPITLPEAFTILEGGIENGAVAGLDADGDPIVFILVESVTNGSLVFAANGAYTYEHNGTETTTDSFRFRAWDGKAYSGIRTAFITITPVNDAPVAVNGTDETDFETVLTGNIHDLISDIDSADWTLAVSSSTSHGTLVLNADGSFTYTPEAGFSGDDVFTFKANDGSLDSNIATYTITVNEEVIIEDPETPLTPLSFWWAYLLGLLFLLLFFLRPNLKYALVDKNGKETIVRRHIFANGKDDLFVDLDDKNIEGLVAVDLVIYKQLVKRERGNKITFNLFKKPAKVINVPEDLKEAIEDKIKL